MWPEFYSVVIPMYRSAGTIRHVVTEVCDELTRIKIDRYEIILVNDCSPDNVLEVADLIARNNHHVKVIDLAANVGQERACVAGYSQARGDYIINLDDDMQTPGYEIGHLVAAIHERDDDIVFASYRESDGRRPLVRRLGTWLNWRMAEAMVGKPKGLETNSFLVMRKFVGDAIVSYSGFDMYTFGIMFAVTSHVSNVEVEHRKRAEGVSGNSLKKLARLWLSGLLSYSMRVCRLPFWLGAALLLASAIALFAGMVGPVSTPAILLLGAIVLLGVGIVAEYQGRGYYLAQRMPKYTIRKIISYED